jgi:hypothetical protein
VNTLAECQNCGAAVSGRYCSACGQVADVRIPTLGHVLIDALGDILSFDSRLWRSLSTLAFEPGRLTNRYLEGQRAKYTPPFRMYLMASLVFFILFSVTRPDAVQTIAGVGNAPAAGAPGDRAAAIEFDPVFVNLPEATGEETVHLTADENGWSCNLDANVGPATRERLNAACEKIEADSGASFSRAFADNFPVMMLVFIPIVAALMKMLYAFSGRKYVEHLLFFAHAHTFFFFVAIVTLLLSQLGSLVPLLDRPILYVSLLVWAYFPVYLYLAMRHVYRQGHALTTVKYVVLGAGYVVSFLATLLGLVIYTAITL